MTVAPPLPRPEITPDDRTRDAAERLARRLMDAGHVADGAEAWLTVLSMRPLDPDVAASAASALREAGRLQDSLTLFDRVLRRRPNHIPAAAGRAATLFAMEHWKEAFEAFEVRFRLMDDPPKVTQTLADGRIVPRPAWRGGAVPKHVLVLAEQGLGDTIQFIRFLPRLIERGAEVTFVVERKLHALISSMGLPVQLRDRETPGSVDGVKGWLPLMSLPAALGLETVEDLSTEGAYLRPDPARVARMREMIAGPGLKIGISWQGNPDPRIDRDRSVPLQAFAPLAALPGVRLISLQKGFGTEQLDAITFRDKIEIIDGLDEGADAFLDSAALMSELDAVVTSCTSLAHLAGALGCRTHVLLKAQGADWRWLQNRSDTVWYPATTLHRQPKPGDWMAAMSSVVEALTPKAAPAAMPSPEPVAARAPDGVLLAPVSLGELLDKLTILEIKLERITDPDKLANIAKERDALADVCSRDVEPSQDLDHLVEELQTVNETLWDVEDALRDLERAQDFGEAFVTLARAVYHTNDRRAALKREINTRFGSGLVEEKSYASYA